MRFVCSFFFLANTFETRSFTHSINERNELTMVDHAASSGANPPPAADSQTIYDQSGNLVFDGTYFYQYDAWGRLIQINLASHIEGEPGPESLGDPQPNPCPPTTLNMGAMIKHFTYEGLGCLVRVQSPGQVRRQPTDGLRDTEESQLCW